MLFFWFLFYLLGFRLFVFMELLLLWFEKIYFLEKKHKPIFDWNGKPVKNNGVQS